VTGKSGHASTCCCRSDDVISSVGAGGGALLRSTKERLDKYVEVRDYLLREFKLTAEQHRERFRTAVKSLTETYTLFGSRVKNLFLYYLQNRKAKTVEQVIDLLVSDRKRKP